MSTSPTFFILARPLSALTMTLLGRAARSVLTVLTLANLHVVLAQGGSGERAHTGACGLLGQAMPTNNIRRHVHIMSVCQPHGRDR